jgi:hypothetical protein
MRWVIVMIKFWEACSCKLELKNGLSICFETNENENLCRKNRSQDLHGVYRILAKRLAFEITAMPQVVLTSMWSFINFQTHKYIVITQSSFKQGNKVQSLTAVYTVPTYVLCTLALWMLLAVYVCTHVWMYVYDIYSTFLYKFGLNELIYKVLYDRSGNEITKFIVK